MHYLAQQAAELQFEPIALSGLGLPILVYLTVRAARQVGLVKDGDAARRANYVAALAWSSLWAAIQFAPAIAPYAGIVVVAIVSALIAAGGHEANERRKNGSD